jgi:hypothetical protein
MPETALNPRNNNVRNVKLIGTISPHPARDLAARNKRLLPIKGFRKNECDHNHSDSGRFCDTFGRFDKCGAMVTRAANAQLPGWAILWRASQFGIEV